MLNGTKKNSANSGVCIDRDGGRLSDKGEISNSFNDYFISIPYATISNSNVIHGDEYLNIIPSNENSIFLKPTSTEEIYTFIFSLNMNSNLSEIPLKFIKLASYEYSNILSIIVNRVLETGVYPDMFKIAKIRPIPKKKPSNYIINNRPISILPIFDKVLEKVLHDRLYSFFEKYNLICNSQFGFRRGMGTDMAALKLLDFLYTTYAESMYSICLYLDFTKAFDCIDHKILLAKLWRYGIRGKPYELLKSFLSDRKQYVTFNNIKSYLGDVKIGIPQGSCLGPLLFIIYVNDLYYFFSDKCQIIQFADDTALVKTSNNLNQLIAYMNVMLYKIQSWCENNYLCLNLKKTKAMIFTLKNYNKDLPQMTIGENVIEFVDKFKYLGLYFDSKLNFNHHITDISKKLSVMTGISRYVSPYLNLNSAVSFYYAFVFSKISYGITVWGGNLNKSTVSNIFVRKHKKIVINLFSKHAGYYDYDKICKNYNILKPIEIYKYFLAQLVFKQRQCKSPLSLSRWLESSSNERHEHNTRFVNLLELPFPRVDVIKYGYIYNFLKLWNEISADIKSTEHISSFKRKLRITFIGSY